MSHYENGFVWLADAGIALPCHYVTEAKTPLKISEQGRLSRLFMNDTGLLCTTGMENIPSDFLNGDVSVNMGSFLENAFAQLLKSIWKRSSICPGIGSCF
jgi:hypothetical protein